MESAKQDKRDDERGEPRSASWYEILKDYCRDGGVCIDVDGVEDNGTSRDELVDAEIEGNVRFGGLGEFFTPWDLQERKEIDVRKNDNQKILAIISG